MNISTYVLILMFHDSQMNCIQGQMVPKHKSLVILNIMTTKCKAFGSYSLSG